MSKSSGKTTVVVALIGFVGVIGAALISNIDKIEKYFSSDAPKISFYKADFFKGDKGIGGNNTCPTNLILVSEVYETNDEEMDNIILIRSSSNGYNSKANVYPRGMNGYYEFNSCVKEENLMPLKVKSIFKREGGKEKTTLIFDINFTKDQLKDANEWSKRTL